MSALSSDHPRLDVEIYNESNALFVSSAAVRQTFEQSDDENVALRSAVNDRELFAVELDQDDGFIARVVLGDLSAKEKSEWVGRGSRKLKLPDGKLVVAGGASYVSENLDDEFYEIIDVPSGEYFVTIYQHLPSVNGERITRLEGWEGFLPYFRKTRSKRKNVPAWISELAEFEGEDAGDVEDDESEELVAFVIQLLPTSNRRMESPLEDDCFVSTEQRIPAKCPLGIVAIGIEQPSVMSDAEVGAAERAAHELRFSDDADLALLFRPVADAIHTGNYEQLPCFFVPSLRDRVAAWAADRIQSVREAAGTGDDLPELPHINDVWRDWEPGEEALQRWTESSEQGNNLFDADAVTVDRYLGDVRCEFGNMDEYIGGDIAIYTIADVLVCNTADGPQLAGISIY